MARGRQIDAGAEFLGESENRSIGEIGGHAGFDVVDKPLPKDAFELVRFMEEPVTIVVNPPSDPDEPMVFTVSVNGVTQPVMRGQPMTIKRKYVEVLARAKRTDFSQTLDERMGESMNILRTLHSLRYPFSVMSDPNPNGGSWLIGVLAEAR